MRFSFLGIQYDNLTREEALAAIRSLPRKSSLFFINSDCVYKAQKDKEYRKILNGADLVLPDGVGIEAATRLLGSKMKANLNGTDFTPEIFRHFKEKSFFLLGAGPGVGEKAAKTFRKMVPGLRIVGVKDGFFKDSKAVIAEINASKADILLVAMGAPKQEKWIHRHRKAINCSLCIGVGGLFDYYSGRIRRAPKIIQQARMEWFWRIMMEPRRLSKRYFIDGFKFSYYTMKSLVK